MTQFRRPLFPAVLLALCAATAQAAPLLRMPAIHGDQVVFTCEGDLWLGTIAGGTAERLTSDPGIELHAKFSPDGSKVAYSADYQGVREVYVLDLQAGPARRVTYLNRRTEMVDWAADGQHLLVRSQGPTFFFETWLVPAQGGLPQRFPLEFAVDVSFAPDGDQFVFTRFSRAYEPWFGYVGGKKNDVWLGNRRDLKFRKIVETPGTNEWPVWTRKGVAYLADADGKFSVRLVGHNGGQPRTLAGPFEKELRFLATDGDRLVYENGSALEMIDLKDGRRRELSFKLRSDLRHAMPYRAAAQRFLESASPSPNGGRVLVAARGAVLSLPVGEGAVRQLAGRSGVRLRLPRYSPNGQHVAYVSDETGEQQLYVSDAQMDNARALTSDARRQLIDLAWSPDGSKIGLVDSETRLRVIDVATGAETFVGRGVQWAGPKFSFHSGGDWLVQERITVPYRMTALEVRHLPSGATHQLGDGMIHDFAPRFSTDGRFIAFLSRRNLAVAWDPLQYQVNVANVNKAYLLAVADTVASPLLPKDPEPVGEPDKPSGGAAPNLVPTGLYERLVEIPLPPRTYRQIEANAERVFALAEDVVHFYEFESRTAGVLARGVTSFELTPDGKKVFLSSGQRLRVVDAKGRDVADDAGLASFANYQLSISPREEWRQIYWDAWRLVRDYFYVRNMHGADWNAVGQKYADRLPELRSRDELSELIRWMLAELSVSHAYTTGGDLRGAQPMPAPSFLGIEVEPHASGYYRIAKIFRGDGFSAEDRSPLAQPGLAVKEGDLLVAVAGVPARVGSPFLDALVGRAGQIVEVRVASAEEPETQRSILVRPTASEQRMRYYEWVRGRREYVEQKGGGRVGYLHMPDMTEFGMQEFLKQYFPLLQGRDAIVLDDRFNGGGNMSQNIVRLLNDRLVNYFNFRGSEQMPYTRQFGAFPGHFVMLTNEFAGSNGEEVLHHFKRLGLGPIVGRQTWGGLVGNAPGWDLIDGGKVFVPNYGAFIDGEWIVEGPGFKPDIDVESDPNAYAIGRDPQLDKAIQLALEAIKKNPPKRETQPPDPVRPPRGGRGY
jgi:tricorn protease